MRRKEIGAQIIGVIVCSMLLAAELTPISYAQEFKDVSYLCVREMAAGLTYNDSLKKWEGAQLRSEGSFNKFILRLRLLKERVQKNVMDEEEDVSDYEVTLTEMETNNEFSCRKAGGGIAAKIVTVVDDEGVFACSARTHSFTFNLEKKRFISIFVHGYVDGIDNNENIPMVSGGTCVEIDQAK